MKPKKLIMSAFCPYAQVVEIDFERFEKNGLFLIAGDTGAGKTTIFDGISFALFGEVSGENRGSDTLRSHFAKAERKTFVQFIFENKGITYEITRNPSYMRPSKRSKDAWVSEKASAELLLPGTDTITGSREVTNKVIDILGVNHQQFKQIAMIAQGEFLKLLFADSEERGKIFRRVFATEFYKNIQFELKNEMSQCQRALKEIKQEILLEYDHIVCDLSAEGYEEFMKLKESVYMTSEMMAFLEQLIAKKKAKKKKQLKAIKDLQTALDLVIQQITSGEELNSLILKCEGEKNKRLSLMAKEDDIVDAKKVCQSAKKARYFIKPKMDEWQRLLKEENNLKQEIDENEKKVQANQALQKTGQEKLKELKEEEKKGQTLQFDIQKIKDNLVDYEKLDQKLKDQEARKQEEKKLNEEKVKREKRLIKIKESLKTIKERLTLLKDTETKKLLYEQEKKDLEEKRSDFLNLNQLLKEGLLIKKELAKAKLDFKKKEGTFQAKKKNYDQLEMFFYREQAGILAENLKINHPCPVCGSLEHPQKAKKSSEAPSQGQLNEEKKKLEVLRSTFQKISENCSGLKIEEDNKDKQIKRQAVKCALEFSDPCLLQEVIEENLKKNAKDRQEVREKLEKAQKESREKKELEKEEGLLEEKEESDKNKLEELKQSLSAHSSYLAGLKAEIQGIANSLKYENKEIAIEELRKKESTIEKMVKALEKAQKNDDELRKKIGEGQVLIEAARKRLNTIEELLKKAKEELDKKLEANDFRTAEDYYRGLRTEDQISQLEKTIKDHEDHKTRVQEAISQFENQINHREKVAIDQLKTKKDQLYGQQSLIQEKVKEIEFIIKTNQQVKESLAKQEKERDKADKEFIAISNLSNTANGKLAQKEKLAFEQYVQGVYLDMVLIEANKRLIKMTDSRYHLLRREEGSNKQSKSGLEIDVKDKWTSKNRAVKSLSGGESFKASMALALGLADIIQRFSGGVELNTVFIDEGFGSLDGESLEKAMEILADLTKGNRLVGIISHLDELKGKIDQKIVIKRDPQGSTISLEAGIH